MYSVSSAFRRTFHTEPEGEEGHQQAKIVPCVDRLIKKYTSDGALILLVGGHISIEWAVSTKALVVRFLRFPNQTIHLLDTLDQNP